MALGGGKIVTTTFPGAYIDFVASRNAANGIGERGIVAMCVKLPTKTERKVIECDAASYFGSSKPLGTAYSEDSMWMFNEVFKHSRKVVVYNMANDGATLDAGLTALESYEFNVIVTDSTTASEVTKIIQKVNHWRDNLGKKVQVVCYNHAVSSDLNNIAVINLASKPILEADDELHNEASLVYWVAGAMAGCPVNKSCTNMLYDGSLEIEVDKSQEELQTAIETGKVMFHLVYGEVRLLEDINSLTEPGDDQTEDFAYNQTIRVIDQIANDIAYLFCTKYLGKIQNNASGRVSFWNDIVTHHKKLETMGAIENFSSENVVVQPGDNIRSIVVQDGIQITGTMSQLFMTVVIE